MEPAIATPTAEPSQSVEPSRPAPTNTNPSEQDWIKETSKPIQSAKPITPPTQAPKPPANQVLPTDGETPERLPNQLPDELPPANEFKIKDINGNERVVTDQWLQKYFQVVGQPELTKLITPENAPLLQHIAERTMKLNNAYAEASKIKPEYESYKNNVETYFQEISKDPEQGFPRMMSEMGLSEEQQDGIVERMALKLLEKREMSPEARENMRIMKEQETLRQQNEQFKRQLEETQTSMEAAQRTPMYQTGIQSALSSVGFEINDASWNAMVQTCMQAFGNQKEPITQEQFNQVARHLAQTAMSFKQASQNGATPPQAPKKVISKGYVAPQQNKPPEGQFQTEQDWMKAQGMKYLG